MKCGLEIHQRLDTNKLFCSCPSKLIENEPADLVIQRRLHPVFSELGEVDKAAVAEFERDRVYEYSVYNSCNCLVETDEEPPHRTNQEALTIALEIAMHLNAKPVDEVHVMRKIVIDGSNTSGFQRTAIIALNGYLETSKGRVGIPQIAIEEESAGIIEAGDKKMSYRLDRLGIPLVEISTDPDIKEGQHLLEVAEKIGMILRATGKVARGLGTIRQDVNVSIEGGARVEIKGAQDLKMLPLLAENEVRRQKELISIFNEMKKRLAATAMEIRPVTSMDIMDLTHLFSKTSSTLISSGIQKGHHVLGKLFYNKKGLFGKEIQPNRRFGTELSDYAKTAGVKGIIHSDEDLSKYKISEEEINKIKDFLKFQPNDVFVLVVAEPEVAQRALAWVGIRLGPPAVIEETRRANPDGTSSYMRPLPGKARLYPETDIPSIIIDEKMLKEVKESKGESLENKKAKLQSLLNSEMADKVLRSRHLSLFEKLIELDIEPMLIANTIENTLVSIRREGFEIASLEETLFELFTTYKKGEFVKAAIPDILKLMSKGKNLEQALNEGNLRKISGNELRKIAEEFNYDVAKIMQKYRLRIEPSEIAKLKK